MYFYHGCNILTNQIAQTEIDKSHIKHLSISKCDARVQGS